MMNIYFWQIVRIKNFIIGVSDGKTIKEKEKLLTKNCCICENDFNLELGGCGFKNKYICQDCLEKLPNTKGVIKNG